MDYLQKDKLIMNRNIKKCVPGNPLYSIGDDVTFNFDRGHGRYTVYRGIIGIVDSYGSLEFYMEQPSYDIWIKEENGKDCLCKHVPEKDIVQVHNKSN